jgi:hypothetical protein
MPDLCYPCSVHAHPCVQDEGSLVPVVRPSVLPTWRDRLVEALGEPAPGCHWFDVALWLNVGRDLFPAYDGCMQVPNAFSAVEGMMRFYRLWSVSYASVRALDGSLIYRAWRVWVDLREEGDK